jgi:hypothetical protein
MIFFTHFKLVKKSDYVGDQDLVGPNQALANQSPRNLIPPLTCPRLAFHTVRGSSLPELLSGCLRVDLSLFDSCVLRHDNRIVRPCHPHVPALIVVLPPTGGRRMCSASWQRPGRPGPGGGRSSSAGSSGPRRRARTRRSRWPRLRMCVTCAAGYRQRNKAERSGWPPGMGWRGRPTACSQSRGNISLSGRAG